MEIQNSTQTNNSPAPEEMPTIWEIPDPLWHDMEQLIGQYDPPKPTGRKRIDARKAFDGMLFRLRTGCQWNQLPERFGDDSSVHRTFQRWQDKGLFGRLFALVAKGCDQLGGVDWQWQSADGCLLRTFGAPKKGLKASKSAPILPTEPVQEPK
jgi:transposase